MYVSSAFTCEAPKQMLKCEKVLLTFVFIFFSSIYETPVGSLSEFHGVVHTAEKWQFLETVVKSSVKDPWYICNFCLPNNF